MDLFFSSFVFLTNVFVNYYLEEYIYAILFFLLFLTSINVHTNNSTFNNLIDKISIFCVVLYGAYYYYNKTLNSERASIVPIVCFLATIYLYTYGFFVDEFCFNKDIKIANYYHAMLHIASSIGHHFIVLG